MNHPPTVHPDDHLRWPGHSRCVVLCALFIQTTVRTNMARATIHINPSTAWYASSRSTQSLNARRSAPLPARASMYSSNCPNATNAITPAIAAIPPVAHIRPCSHPVSVDETAVGAATGVPVGWYGEVHGVGA